MVINIIKVVVKEISKPLTHIFNLSFSFGIIPDKLKIALITQFLKVIKKTCTGLKTTDQYLF